MQAQETTEYAGPRIFSSGSQEAQAQVTAVATYICEERPRYVKRDLYMKKETYICEKRPIYVKRDLYV